MFTWFWSRHALIAALADAEREADGFRHDAEFWKADSDNQLACHMMKIAENTRLKQEVADLRQVVEMCRADAARSDYAKRGECY
jgi:hypothetical protein